MLKCNILKVDCFLVLIVIKLLQSFFFTFFLHTKNKKSGLSGLFDLTCW